MFSTGYTSGLSVLESQQAKIRITYGRSGGTIIEMIVRSNRLDKEFKKERLAKDGIVTTVISEYQLILDLGLSLSDDAFSLTGGSERSRDLCTIFPLQYDVDVDTMLVGPDTEEKGRRNCKLIDQWWYSECIR